MKPCPFCAEQIQDAAIKCRWCGSMLDGQPGQPPAAVSTAATAAAAAAAAAPVTAAAAAPVTAAAAAAAAAPVTAAAAAPVTAAAAAPVTALAPVAAAGSPALGPAAPSRVLFDGTPSWKAWFWSYVAAGVLSLVLVGLVWMAILNWKRKSLRYKITERTIDYETGLLSRRIETLQLWRVQDIDFRQSLLQRMLGVAEIRVFTKDTTDPELVLRGLPEARQVFEELKNAAELARQQRVVGLVQ